MLLRNRLTVSLIVRVIDQVGGEQVEVLQWDRERRQWVTLPDDAGDRSTDA